MKDLAAELDRLKAAHLYRERRLVASAQGREIAVDGRSCLAFCSNDYLGLAAHPELVDAFKAGAERYGVGAGASQLVVGHTEAHRALEAEVAAFVGRPAALVFATGYMANMGVVDALVARGERVCQDRLNHASLLDAARLAGARLLRYPHGDLQGLDRCLASRAAALVATDGIFSMDGDAAPVTKLAAIARRHGVPLLVDDAHGLGVMGATGRGTLEAAGLGLEEVPILVGTFGKAFGTAGAFVAGKPELVDILIQRARTYIYTTAMPPAVTEATRAGLAVAARDGWRRTHLNALIHRLRQGAAARGIDLSPSASPIQPLILGASESALRVSQGLWERGILVSAMRPPTVPAGTARLRITLSAAHRESDVDRLLAALDDVR